MLTGPLTYTRIAALTLTGPPTAKSIVRYGLPPLPERSVGSDTDGSKNKHHKEAVIVCERDNQFAVLRGLVDQLSTQGPYIIWNFVNPKTLMLPQYTSEASIAGYVNIAMTEIILALTPVLGDLEITLAPELEFNGDKADMWIVQRLGIPIGVLEVKKPGNNADGILNSAVVAGQILDYMQRVRQFHGIDHVFGIVSTYREWRVFWLDDCDQIARIDDLTVLQAPSSGVGVDLRPPVPEWGAAALEQPMEALTVTQFKTSPPLQEATRTVRAGRIMLWNDSDLVETLASVLCKMATSPATRRIALLERGRPYVDVGPTGWTWKLTTAAVPTPRYWPMPHKRFKHFLLLLHLGDGVNGRAWLAMTASGAACVLKFSQSPDGSSALQDEATRWHDIWGVTAVRVQQLANKMALVMPYVYTCDKAADRTPEVHAAARAAVAHMARKGWEQNDIKWDHVGLYRQDGVLRAVLVDLGDVSRVSAEQQAEAEQRMLIKLGIVPLAPD